MALVTTLGLALSLGLAAVAHPDAGPGPVPTPTHVHVSAATTTSVTVAWRRPPGATRFRVAWSDDEQMTDRRHRRVWHRRFTVSDLEPDSCVWVIVRVVRLDGEHRVGPASTPIEARTTDEGPTPPPTTPPPTPPPTTPPPTGSTLFGANYTTLPQVDEDVYDGRAEAARIFFQGLGGVQFSRNGAVQEALADGVTTFVISWKETDLAAIRTFLAGIPDGLTVYTTFNHEPEDDHGRPGDEQYAAWSAEYRRQWSLQSPVMRAAGTIPTNILMAWTLQSGSGRDVADWTPPAGTVDVFAFDAYYGPGKDPSALVDRMVAATRAAGFARTGLAETGGPASDPDRLAKTAEMRSSIIAAGCFAWALYWNSGGSPGGFDGRMDEATADAWFG